MTEAVVVRGLTKTYQTRSRRKAVEEHGPRRVGELRAVDAIDLTVHQGEIYGFLGPNGAGKTTTIRMLLGLVRPTAGNVSVLGADPGAPGALARVGALIEGPAFYPYLSGRDNLRVLAGYSRRPIDAVDEALDLVQLTERAADRYSGYSLGMKQRLGVAAALLKDPALVVLDEPTNGLDPAGMRDMRALVRDLGAAGRTVLLSSHLMAEVQQLCDRVAVIDHGKVLVESTVRELRGAGELLVAGTPGDRTRQVLAGLESVRALRALDGALRVEADRADTASIARALVEAGVALTELRYVERDLEDVFMELTGHQRTERPPLGGVPAAIGQEVAHV